jgi:hypothetical protein
LRLQASPLMDSKEALRRLLADARSGATIDEKSRGRGLGWTAAYLAAALCALAIAFM